MVLRYEDVPHRLNLADRFIDRNVREGGGRRIALLVGDREVTYAELAALTDRVGNVLRDLGVRPGSRVLLALRDGIEFVATWYAAQKIGAVTAEVYTYLQPKDYGYYLRYTDAAVVVVDAATVELLRAADPDAHHQRLAVGVAAAGLRPGEHSFDRLVDAASHRLDPAPTGRDDVAIWKFTTGSTGEPKACVHAARSAFLSFEWYARGVLGIAPDDIVLPVPKLFFGYARDLTALFPFGVGGAGVAFPERTTPERIFELIAWYRPTILVNVPTMMSAMVSHPDAARHDLSCLRLCTSAGEALPAPLLRRWEDTFGVEVVDGIGSSEAYHIYVSNRPGRGRPGTVGEVVPGYHARVVDEAGRPVPDGEIGRLQITGRTVALEYWQAPDKTAATFDGDTLTSEDLFVRDADGYFAYRGRADDLLKVGGVWVAPSEIEHCLIGHPGVAECAVIGYVDDGLVRPRAYVVPRAGADPTVEALREHVRGELAPYKAPRDVRFVSELPKTANGKLDRRALRELDSGTPAGPG